MNTNSASKKDNFHGMPDRRYYFTGSSIDPGYFRKRSWLERSGADHWVQSAFYWGMYLFPDIKNITEAIVNFIFVFPLLFYILVVTVIIPLCPWCVLFPLQTGMESKMT